jgi:hypothetical protein
MGAVGGGTSSCGQVLEPCGSGNGYERDLACPTVGPAPWAPASAVSWERGGGVIVESRTELEVTAEWPRSHRVTAEHGRQRKCGSTAR